MKISDIIDLSLRDVMKMNRNELAKLTSRMSININQRTKRLEKNNITSPALLSLYDSGGKISVKNKNINQVRAEFFRARKFLQSKTSTVKGYTSVMKKVNKAMGGELPSNVQEDFWRTYRHIEGNNPYLLNLYGSEQALHALRDEFIKGTGDIIDNVTRKLNDYYMEYQNEFNENEVDLFELGGIFEFDFN